MHILQLGLLYILKGFRVLESCSRQGEGDSKLMVPPPTYNPC